MKAYKKAYEKPEIWLYTIEEEVLLAASGVSVCDDQDEDLFDEVTEIDNTKGGIVDGIW